MGVKYFISIIHICEQREEIFSNQFLEFSWLRMKNSSLNASELWQPYLLKALVGERESYNLSSALEMLSQNDLSSFSL